MGRENYLNWIDLQRFMALYVVNCRSYRLILNQFSSNRIDTGRHCVLLDKGVIALGRLVSGAAKNF